MGIGTGIGEIEIVFKEHPSTPSTPVSTYKRLYFKSDGLYYINSAGVEKRIVEDTYVKASWFEQVDSGTTGTVALPTGATIVLDEWAGGVDALASTMSGGIPTYNSPTTSLLVKITATLDGSGNYTLSGTPSAYPVAVVYVYKVTLTDLDITKVLGGIEIITPGVVDTPVDGDTLSAISANWAYDHNARDATASVQGHATAAQITKLDGIEAGAVALATVKADSDIADAITKKHSQNTDTALGAQVQDLNMNTHQIKNVVDPTLDQDAATKKYVDSSGSNFAINAILGTL